ncbi:pum [Symbiodinium sp. CCMP2592]|nr:pum [Symbiodinium sp. CCMP2592]
MGSGASSAEKEEVLAKDREFILKAVKETKAWWLVKLASKELSEDAAFVARCKEAAGDGLVFTYYDNSDVWSGMIGAFHTTGASVPGGKAYDEVMKKLRQDKGSTATVWFGEEHVFGPSANDGKWVHTSRECGRDDIPVPSKGLQDAKWKSLVESRSNGISPQVGRRYKCWCCHWIREVRRQHEKGAVICCATSNIYYSDWVRTYGAGSSELSDADAKSFNLPREVFKNGKPEGWGEGKIKIDYSTFERRAPVHERTKQPLGVGCRWERQVLDNLGFPVYAFFMP